jgi:hypothetical protein
MVFRRLKNNDLILLLVFFFSFFNALSPLYAKGRQDDVFSEADRLIAARNYDEAIDRLVGIARNDPSMFDKVQLRLRRIVQSSNRYAEIASQLLDTIERNPDDSERIFELSQALDSLGEARTEEAREFIRQVQEVARYSVFRNQLESILVEGRRLIDSGQYTNAYDLYLTGFTLYESVFDESGYSANVKFSVNRTRDIISRASASFTRLSQRITAVATEVSALSATAFDNPREQMLVVTRTLSRIRGDLNDFVQLKSLIWDARDGYRGFGAIESNDEGRYYITFGNLLINGRSDQDVREGLLGAVDGLWRAVSDPLETLASTAMDEAFDDILQAGYSQSYTRTRSLIEETETALRGSLDMITLNGQFTARDEIAERSVFGRAVSIENLNYFTLVESLNRTLVLLAQAMGYAESRDTANQEMLTSTTLLDYRARRLNATQSIQREIGIRSSLVGIESAIRNLIVTFEQYLDELRPLSSGYDGVARGADFFREGLTFVGTIDTDLSVAKIASASRQYTVENEEYALNYPLRLSQLNTGLTITNGILRTSSYAAGESYLSKNPLQASREFDSLNDSLTTDIASGRALLNRYDTDDASIIRAQELAVLRTAAADQLAQYEALHTQGVAMAAEAWRAVAEAEALRTEGARLYRNASEALGRNDFDGAKNFLDNSDTQYGASLAIQDSDTIRTETRTRSLALSTEIMLAREAYIRREVTSLVARAQPEFYANNHEIAEQLLVRASTLYATISDEEDPDVRYWLIIVRNALLLRSGRTIPFTAPLYPEMSQLLSSAQLEYVEGMNLMNTQRTQALQYFAGVRQKAQEVKLLFPLNQEANLLELRIDQVVDPAAFNASFQERLNTAISGTKTADLQAFADLQDLAMINPNYRGMSQIIYQAEIDMGIRPPPPNEAAIARSRDLTRSAQNLIAGGVRSNMEVAQQQLSEALRVNPDNTTAVAELDRVERLMGRRAASELEAAVDNDYQDALRELLAGNKLIAYSIVRRVLARPEYRNSGRFQELLQRIESVL